MSLSSRILCVGDSLPRGRVEVEGPGIPLPNIPIFEFEPKVAFALKYLLLFFFFASRLLRLTTAFPLLVFSKGTATIVSELFRFPPPLLR